MMKRFFFNFQAMALAMGFFWLIAAPAFHAAGESRPALDKKNMDLSVRPGDDFFRYANGAWIRDLAMPADKSEYDAFDQVREQNRARLHELFEGLAASAATAPRGTAAQKIGDFYALAMDAAASEALGSAPLAEDFARIAKAATVPEIQDLLAVLHRENFPVLFGAGVEVDLMNSKAYAYYLAQSGLGMPDRDYYTRDDADAQKLREQYLAHVTAMLKLLGDAPEPAAAAARTVMAIGNAAGAGIQDAGRDARHARPVQQDDPGAAAGTQPRLRLEPLPQHDRQA